MALEASVLTVQVVSQGITDATKALNDLAAAGEKAEKGTSNIGKGAAAVGQAAKDAAQAGVDAAQQTVSQYNAIIDKMTEDAKAFYSAKAQMEQKELFDGMAIADKVMAVVIQNQQDRAAMREQEKQDTLRAQQEAMDAAVARYNKEIEMMNKQFDAYQSQQAKQEASAQAKGDALNMAGQRANDYAKLQADIKALKDETDKLAAAEKAEQAQRESIDMMAQQKRWKDEAAAVREATAAKMAAEKAEQQLKADGDAFVAMLKRQADTVGMTTTQLKEYNAEQLRTKAAQLGVSQQVEQHIQTLQKAKGPHESFNLLTAGSARELMVLGHELSQGSFQRFGGSLIVLAERINFLPSLLEKAASAAGALGMGLGLFVTAIAAAVAVVAAFGVAIAKGAAEQRVFNNALILTGNYAGMTADNMEQMANSIGKSSGSIGDAKKAIVELASSGKFTADQIGFIAEAVTEVEHVTGKSGEKMIQEFEQIATMAVTSTKRSTDVISQHVLKLNDHYHFLTAAQFEHISMLEKEGDAQGAANEAEKAYADALKSRAEEIKSNLGTIQTVWMDIKHAAGEAWDAMLGIGKKVTASDTIERVKGMIEHMDNQPGWISGKGQGGSFQKQFDEARMRLVKELTAAVVEKNKADADAIQQGKDQQAQQAGMHAMARTIAVERQVSKQTALELALAEEKVNNALAKQALEIDKRSKDPNVVAAAMKAEAKYSEEAIAKRNADITAYYSKKQPKPKSEGLSGLDESIAAIAAKYDVEKRGYDNEIKLIDLKKQYGLMADTDAEREKSQILDTELQRNKQRLEEELKVFDNFHSTNVRLTNEAAKKRLDIEKNLAIAKDNIEFKKKADALLPDSRGQKYDDAADKASASFIAQTAAQTQAIQFKIDAYKNLSEEEKRTGVTEKQMQDSITQSQIDWYDEKMKSVADMGPASEKEIQRLKNEKAALVDKTKAQKELEELQAKNSAALNQSAALTKIATEQVKVWKDTGNEIEKALKSAFGNSGEAAGKMFKAFADGQASQIDLANQIRLVKTNASLDEQTKLAQTTDLQNQAAQTQIGMYGSMADAAAGFFDKQSTGYKIATSISKAFHIAETAMALASIPAKLAAGAATMFAQSGWGGFAGVAAMTAAVAAFGVAVTSGGGGGPMTSADQQKIQGTGTVLGSPTITDGNKVELAGAVSQSIKNSLTLLEKSSGLGLVVQNDMLDAMRKLNDNISGFAKVMVQNYDLSNPKINLNTNNGLASTLVKSVVGMGLGFVIPGLGNLLGKVATAIFGGKQTIDDSGITIVKSSLGSIDKNGANAQSYANITTSGGWFKSDKHDTPVQSLGADFNNQVTMVVKSMQDTLVVAAKGLGLDSKTFNDKLQSFVVDIGNISLKGMTGDQIQATLQGVFSKLGDQMATFAFADLQKYQQIGEGLLETVARVANDLQQVNDVFAVLGKTIPKGLEGIAQAEKLVASFGSSDAMSKAVKSYETSIYSDDEKLAPVIQSVQDQLDRLGLSGVKTKEDFKLVVDSLDLTTQSGVDMFNKLTTLAPTFGSAMDGISKANQVAKDSLTSVIDKLKQFSTTITTFSNGLYIGNNSPFTPAQKLADAASQFQNTITKAMQGDSTAQGNVTNNAQSYLDAARTMYSSSDSYTQIFNQVQQQLAAVQKFADNGVSAAQGQLNVMNDQLTSLKSLNTTSTDILSAVNSLVSGTYVPPTVATQNGASNAELLQQIETLTEKVVALTDATSANANTVAAAVVNSNAENANTTVNGIKDALTGRSGSTRIQVQSR